MISMEFLEYGFQRMAESQMNSWHSVSAPGFHRAYESLESKRWEAYASLLLIWPTSHLATLGPVNKAHFWALVTGSILMAPNLLFSFVYFLLDFSIRGINPSSPTYVVFAKIWLCFEGMFFIYRWYFHGRAHPRFFKYPLPSISETRMLLDRILSLRYQCNADQFLSGWFLGTPVHCIRKQNMRQFLAYSLYHSSYEDLDQEYKKAVEDHIAQVELAWGLCFEEGWNGKARFMSHTIDPLFTLHHPLFLYIWGEMVALLTGLLLRHALGFRLYSNENGGIKYWLRYPKPSKINAGPIVKSNNDQASDPLTTTESECFDRGSEAIFFLHGLGIGITPYLFFIQSLVEYYNKKTIVILEFSHLSLRLVHSVPSAQFLAEEINKIHSRHKLPPSCFVAHSYGSLVLANLCRQFPHIISSLGFLDPVCFLLCLPDVVFNFVYRGPKCEPSVDFLFDLIRWAFCSKETQVARTLCRGFDWHQLHVWGDQVERWPTVVLLGGKDRILPAPHVKTHLKKHRVQVLYYDEFQHAECLFRVDAMKQFLCGLNVSSSGSGLDMQCLLPRSASDSEHVRI